MIIIITIILFLTMKNLILIIIEYFNNKKIYAKYNINEKQ